MRKPAIWFPAVKTNSGSDIFTELLVTNLNKRNIRAEITWLPHYSEYLPWFVKKPATPHWANIVHINSWLNSRFIPKNIPIITNIHLCVQDPALKKYKSPLQQLYHQHWITPIERGAINNSKKIVAVSQYTAEQASSYFKNDTIDVIYNGVDTNIFKPGKKNHTRRPFRLLFSGNHSKRKGFDLLPSIMTDLGEDYKLYYTAGRKELKHKLPKNMHALPRLKYPYAMAEAYRNADALLFPTRLEGFGLVAAEAMSCGLPVITSNNSALPEIIIDKFDGFLCEQDNVEKIVDTIRNLANDQEKLNEIANRARDKILENFTVDKMTENYIEMYYNMLK